MKLNSHIAVFCAGCLLTAFTAGTASAQDTQTAAQAVASLQAQASAQTDKTLGSIGTDLTAKATALIQSAAANTNLTSRLTTSLQSLLAGKDAEGLTGSFDLLKSANLTDQQKSLAKDVGNLTSAYVVQKNFASLTNSQTEVANIVTSLRGGHVATAIPSIQKVAQDASLTDGQKKLMGTVADKYAPGLKSTSDKLKKGFMGLKSLTGQTN
jgi:hypothetical protein